MKNRIHRLRNGMRAMDAATLGMSRKERRLSQALATFATMAQTDRVIVLHALNRIYCFACGHVMEDDEHCRYCGDGGERE